MVKHPDKVRARPPQGHKVFVKKGDTPPKLPRSPPVLETASDWRIAVDLPGTGYAFPAHIAVIGLKPDLVLWSEELRLIIIIELTVPAEVNMRAAKARKTEKYGKPDGLADTCRRGPGHR